MHLWGADDVRSAGHSIRSAAEQMSSAAMTMDSAACRIRDTMDQHQAFLEDWLSRLEIIVTARLVIDPVATQVLHLRTEGQTDGN
jgi:orotate phosphoribosyltransferase